MHVSSFGNYITDEPFNDSFVQQSLCNLSIKLLTRKRLFNISVPKEFLDYIRPSFHLFDYDTKQLEQRWQKELNLKLQ